MKAWTRRDLTIVAGQGEDCLVIACDSCGAVGHKEGDVLKAPPRYAAKFTARVALTEVLCSGAMPVAVSNGVACEMQPTGEETIKGIQDELADAGFADIVLTGSTEENFPTVMTAMAITVIGTAGEHALKFDRACAGDQFLLLGLPRVGTEIDLESRGFYPEIRRLLAIPEVREIVPVGSRGAAYEAKTLASLNQAAYIPCRTDVDCFKSAGPVSCLLVLCAETAVRHVMEIYQPSAAIGRIG